MRKKSLKSLKGIRSLSLAIPVKIRITRAIRGFRPEAERTVSANSPSGELDVAGPVGPSSRVSAF
jgi:hypothetical protein